MVDIDFLAKNLSMNFISQQQLKENERIINQMQNEPGYLKACLTLACNIENKYSDEISLNAAIQLKNSISQNWNSDKINLEEKAFIRNNIIDSNLYAINKEDLKKSRIFNQCLKNILKTDFSNGEFKDEFINQLKRYFDSKNQNMIYTGIISYYQLSKLFEIENETNDLIEYYKTFNEFNQAFFFFLDNCQDINNNFQNMIIYKILRIFMKTIHSSIPSILRDNSEIFDKWMMIILKIINIKITKEQSENLIIKKLKKISFQIVMRLYQKYSIKFRFSENDGKFYSNWEKYIQIIFESFYNIYSNENNIITEDCLSLIYKFFINFIKKKDFDKKIFQLFSNKNMKERLIKDTILSKSDLEFRYSSPHEYISNDLILSSIFKKKRNLVIELINYISLYNNSQYLKEYSEFFFETLQINEENIKKEHELNSNENEYNQLINGKLNAHLIKEAILFIFEKIYTPVLQHEKELLSNILKNYIIAELDCKVGLLRERVCSFLKNYSQYKFDENDSLFIMEKICFLLKNDNEIPVKSIAAITIPKYIKKEKCKNIIKENIKDLILLYLDLMKKIELEELIRSINLIVLKFQNEIRDIIVPLCEYFYKYFIEKAQKEREIELTNIVTSEVSAVLDHILKMFLGIIKYFINDKDIFSKIEKWILEILKYCLSKDGNDHLEEALSIITVILEKSNKIPEKIWCLFKDILVSTLQGEDYEYEFFEETVTCICYFIAKDNETFLKSDNEYLKLILVFFDKIIEKFPYNSEKLRYLYQIYEVMLECCKSKVDQVHLLLLKYIKINLVKAKKHDIESLCELLSCCIVYNSDIAIKYFIENGDIYKIYLKSLSQVNLNIETKRNLLALCCLLTNNNSNELIKNDLEILIKYSLIFGNSILNSKKKENKNINPNKIGIEENSNEEEENENIDEQEIIDNLIEKEKYNIQIDDKNGPDFDLNKNNNNILDEILGKESNNNLDEGLDDLEDETDEDEDYYYDEIACIGELNNLFEMNFSKLLLDTLDIASNSHLEILNLLSSNREISNLYSQLKNSLQKK